MMKKDPILTGLYEAALEFDRRALWRRFTNFDSFAVEAPGEDAPMFVTILGDGEEEFGLNVLRGPRALATLRALHSTEDPDLFEEMDILGFNIDPVASLEPDSRKMARRAGAKPAPDGHLPDFLAKRPGMKPRRPNRREQKLLLYVIRGIFRATESGQLMPEGLNRPGGITTLSVTGDPNDPDVSVSRKRHDDAEPAERVIKMPPSARRLDHLPRLDRPWLAGLLPMPASFEDDERSFELLLVHDRERDMPVVAEMVPAGEMSDAVEHLLGAFEGDGGKRPPGVPREIVFTSRRLHEAAMPLLEAAGVRCRLEPMPEELHRSFQEIALQLVEDEGLWDMDADDEIDPDGDWDGDDGLGLDDEEAPGPTGPDDLYGWIDADILLTQRFENAWVGRGCDESAPAAVQYFGQDDPWEYYDKFGEEGVEDCYADWCVLSYRPGRGSKTLAEEMLAEGLPEAEEALLRARMQAHPTFYRIVSLDKRAGTVALEDALCGGGVTVHDEALADSGEIGLVFPGRVYPAGDFHLVTFLGVVMDQGAGAKAIEFLAKAGLEFTPDRLRKDAHLFGRLWDWILNDVEADCVPGGPDPDGDRLLPPGTGNRFPSALGPVGLRADDAPLPFEDKPPGTHVREEPKIGRNDPCPCGSGRKYKKCCGRGAENL